MFSKKLTPSKKESEKLLGLDYGTAYIGVAFGSAGFAASVKSISSVNTDQAISEIARLAIENKVSRIVVGLPLSDNGKSNSQTFEVKNFVKKLRVKVKFPVVFVNEFMTSKEALAKAVGIGIAKNNRARLDGIAAELILKRYYDGEAETEKRLVK